MVTARVLALLGLGGLSAWTSVARADAPPDAREQAQALFNTARAQMAAENFSEACANFQRSLAFVDGVGTRFNLADCLERSGQPRLALRLFTDVAVRMRQAGDLRRAALAEERVRQLEARLGNETVTVSEAQVTSVALVEKAPEEQSSDPPAQTEAPSAETVEAVPVDEAGDAPHGDTRKTAMLALGGASVIGLVGGTALGLQYLASRRDASDVCSGGVECSAADVARYEELASDMRAERDLALVGFGVGTAALIGTLYLYFTQPSETEASAAVSVEPLVGPGSLFGGSLRGSF
jgi:hypothetical protein